MAHFDTPPRRQEDNKFPGEGRETLVSNPKHVSGQTDIRPNFEKPPHRPDALGPSKLDDPIFVRKR